MRQTRSPSRSGRRADTAKRDAPARCRAARVECRCRPRICRALSDRRVFSAAAMIVGAVMTYANNAGYSLEQEGITSRRPGPTRRRSGGIDRRQRDAFHRLRHDARCTRALVPLERHVTVVFYSLNVAEILRRKPNVRMILLGGVYVPSSDSFAGEESLRCCAWHQQGVYLGGRHWTRARRDLLEFPRSRSEAGRDGGCRRAASGRRRKPSSRRESRCAFHESKTSIRSSPKRPDAAQARVICFA